MILLEKYCVQTCGTFEKKSKNIFGGNIVGDYVSNKVYIL